MPLAIDLTDHRAVVTGGASGIGLACAQQLAAAGAHVTIVDIDAAGAAAAARSIVDAEGAADSHVLDVTSWAACKSFSEETDGIDIVVNCAAAWSLGPFIETDPETWQRDLDITLVGPMHLSRAFLPHLFTGGGSIINIGSDAGRIGEPDQVAYSAAKGGIVAFTKALAKEAGPHGIRVNCVSPALTRTPASQSFIDSVPARSLERLYPLRRIGEPDDVANLVTFLVSDLGSYITGQIISVNGGYTTVG